MTDRVWDCSLVEPVILTQIGAVSNLMESHPPLYLVPTMGYMKRSGVRTFILSDLSP
ncbi:MAG: hypothetical protein HN725_19865 [Alphaproteobacteria bacterium]|nr:hypothetical protein [Alphaproteobacteria bacterium]MBT4083297.1 hypothetical protein [Alphaproteobacteria bacterium]MBT4543051.1 hypothetical protein [Alphaproteobacteria bacterium]MBT7747553.1 hypothetical protein [Alphaproteobacteria bacterium]